MDTTPGRRIRAAMALAGIESFSQLAKRINHRGYGERTLRRLADDEDDSRRPEPGDAEVIARACGVPTSWFWLPFAWLDEAETVAVAMSPPEELERRDELIEEALRAGPARASSETQLRRTADLVMARRGRLFWWDSDGDVLSFYFVRLVPEERVSFRLGPDEEDRFRRTVLVELQEQKLARLKRLRRDIAEDVERGAETQAYLEEWDSDIDATARDLATLRKALGADD